MYRRDFIKLATALGVTGTLPLWSRSVLAAEFPTLPIPALLPPDLGGNLALRVQTGTMGWLPGLKTPTFGVNGPVLGPAIRLQRGKEATVHVKNDLQQATTIHWHGLEIPGTADGGPQAMIKPGSTWTVKLLADQPATTAWFHPHTHQVTGHQVAMGIGGLIVIDDEDSDKLPLPNNWGVDDIPVILQDKRIDAKGQVDYQLDVMTAAVGWFGDMMLTNGAVYPQQQVPRGWIRLRFLNGCNARSLRLAASDGRALYVIGSDGGLLAEPVKLTELPILMGERFEVLVDAGDGKPFDILTLPVRQVGMAIAPFDKPLPVLRVQPTEQQGNGKLPDRLVSLPALPATDKMKKRTLRLAMDPRLDMAGMRALMERYGAQAMPGMGGMGGMGGMMQGHGSMPGMGMGNMGKGTSEVRIMGSNTINAVAFQMNKPIFDVKRGDYEVWTISGEGDMMLHPFHIHGTQFRILSENGRPPEAHRAGWKDTVHVEMARSDVLVRFNHLAPKERAYMAHCHLLEHEDTGMMLSFTVS